MDGQEKPNCYDDRIVRSLRKIIQSVGTYSKKLASLYKVTGPQLSCLLAVKEFETITASQISREIHVSLSTVVGILDRLEEKGLVSRERDQKDRRRVYVSLTDKGQELADTAPPPLQDKLTEALHQQSELEQSTIALALERIVQLMDNTDT